LSYVAPYTGFYFIALKKENATKDVYFELYTFYQELWYQVPESSLSQPADSPNALAVGATYWADDSLEYFSSHGPTDGDNPQVKPDLTAPDGVSTSTYGAGYFYGTSASCPHVAGAAALLKSWNPTLGPDQIKCFLESWAIDLGNTGKDNLYGSGRLDLGTGPPGDPCEGDFDFDGDVDGSDLAIFAADFGRTNCSPADPCEGDFDGDGDVDGSDLAVFAADFGRTDCPGYR
jgi:subtilisin family serine protease